MMIVYGFLNPSTIFWIYLIFSIIWSVHWNEQVFKKKNKLKNASDFYCLMMTVNLLSIKNMEFYTVIGQIDQKFSKKINQWDFGIYIFRKIYQSWVWSSGGTSTNFFSNFRNLVCFKEFWRVFESKKIIKSCDVSERWSNPKHVPKNCPNWTLC